MQVVDFFDAKWVSHTTNDKLFFIFDNNDGKPVSVSSDNAIQPHSVNVRNENNKLCWILPIDHNLNIKKVGSNDLESTCDYLLTVNGKEQLIFGEV